MYFHRLVFPSMNRKHCFAMGLFFSQSFWPATVLLIVFSFLALTETLVWMEVPLEVQWRIAVWIEDLCTSKAVPSQGRKLYSTSQERVTIWACIPPLMYRPYGYIGVVVVFSLKEAL